MPLVTENSVLHPNGNGDRVAFEKARPIPLNSAIIALKTVMQIVFIALGRVFQGGKTSQVQEGVFISLADTLIVR